MTEIVKLQIMQLLNVYLREGFDQLHTFGSAALVEDIRDYLGRRNPATESLKSY